ncbi:hypothetical protein CYMTET_18598 [Cymbomonas tetramitiformis]|uniref:PARP-type domain-containing protein n=1 Tax=Cymbomonas tetramitiformis TaxID=36881 RepID=A0AAE0L658_9CHLO|nr:hypothetical protein CYMTET_18598 [Cymbomonas tetramitiformis]
MQHSQEGALVAVVGDTQRARNKPRLSFLPKIRSLSVQERAAIQARARPRDAVGLRHLGESLKLPVLHRLPPTELTQLNQTAPVLPYIRLRAPVPSAEPAGPREPVRPTDSQLPQLRKVINAGGVIRAANPSATTEDPSAVVYLVANRPKETPMSRYAEAFFAERLKGPRDTFALCRKTKNWTQGVAMLLRTVKRWTQQRISRAFNKWGELIEERNQRFQKVKMASIILARFARSNELKAWNRWLDFHDTWQRAMGIVKRMMDVRMNQCLQYAFDTWLENVDEIQNNSEKAVRAKMRQFFSSKAKCFAQWCKLVEMARLREQEELTLDQELERILERQQRRQEQSRAIFKKNVADLWCSYLGHYGDMPEMARMASCVTCGKQIKENSLCAIYGPNGVSMEENVPSQPSNYYHLDCFVKNEKAFQNTGTIQLSERLAPEALREIEEKIGVSNYLTSVHRIDVCLKNGQYINVKYLPRL